MHDESEKEVVHRLEAFSDIVIGFSLAQLGLSLVIPRHAHDLFANDPAGRGLIALVVTFALVCGIWWSHHRLFRHLFTPTPVSVLANFAALGGIIFLAYSMQVLIHVGLDDRIAYAMYTGSYAWIFLLFACMAWIGIGRRAHALPEEIRANSFRLAVRVSIIGTWLAGITVLAVVVGPRAVVNQWMLLILVAALASHRLITRRAAQSRYGPTETGVSR
jgi:uncharacterized membrane protein